MTFSDLRPFCETRIERSKRKCSNLCKIFISRLTRGIGSVFRVWTKIVIFKALELRDKVSGQLVQVLVNTNLEGLYKRFSYICKNFIKFWFKLSM